MDAADIAVLAGSIGTIAALGWFFFAPRRGHIAEYADGVQRVVVTVLGGYSPDRIHARQGVPWRSSSTGRKPESAPTGWSSPTSGSARACPPTPEPRCGCAPTSREPSNSPAA
ncbi:hypothetical protein ACFQX7_13860 [Luedemannella flava]